jgi:hypothetical protein
MLGRDNRWSKFRDVDPNSLLSWLGLAIGLLSLAGSLVGLSLVFDRGGATIPLRAVAAISTACGVAILLVRFVKALRPVRGRIENWLDSDYKQLVGDRRYLKKVVTAGRRAIGPAHPDESVLMRRLAENPEVLRVCARQRNNGRLKFCGYALLYPLKDGIAEGIASESIRKEAEFGPDPLTPTFEKVRFLYIGMVLGRGRHKPHIKDKLRAELLEILAFGCVEKVFARPGSEGGRKMMQEYGFTPLAGQDDVWSVSGPALRARLQFDQAPPTRIALNGDGDRDGDGDRKPSDPKGGSVEAS